MRLLLLAGSGEGRQLAQALAKAEVPSVASLAGATRVPEALPLPTRIGGFGGADGFTSYMRDEGITAVLDATHPFADQISQRSAKICRDLDIPYLQFLRPAWRPVEGDRWTFLNSEEDAARYIPEGSTVFIGSGRKTLAKFANLEGRRLIVRQIDDPKEPFPFENGEFLVGRPPFSVTEEADLFLKLGIDWLVVKNAGGSTSRSKLDAARELGIPVAMIRRPPQPEAPRVETVTAAMNWVRSQM
ncbi:MAG: cobalt-precorrin-6A reductase [Rhodobacteraceae bacterium]|nr:cobalt-precorrin-6A reductase [Paracoccaceae bacterium]